jgi:hypothetical protein
VIAKYGGGLSRMVVIVIFMFRVKGVDEGCWRVVVLRIFWKWADRRSGGQFHQPSKKLMAIKYSLLPEISSPKSPKFGEL